MVQAWFEVDVLPPPSSDRTTGFAFRLQTSPAEIVVHLLDRANPDNPPGLSIADALRDIGQMLKIPELENLANVKTGTPWDKIFGDVLVVPAFTVSLANHPAVELKLDIYGRGTDPGSGIKIGGETDLGLFHIAIQPTIQVFSLVIGYAGGNVGVKAVIAFTAQDGTTGQPQLVAFPFPVPDQNASKAFDLKFLGIGHRFAPPLQVMDADPIASMFTALEKVFASDDPRSILNTLVKSYYRPDAGWFFALDLVVRGFEIRAVMADPILYGLELTCSSGSLKGLLAEILYQKLGDNLGVFYGKLVLPDSARQIEVGAGSATIPSIALWLYTNGDFKIAIGWPLGPDSFALEILVFIGEAGFYIGKLRSGDNPTGRTEPQVTYNPIVVFGLALQIGVGRSFEQGPVSAQVSLTLGGVFQGLLAWQKPPAQSDDQRISGPPDYYWFSASISLVGVVQGSIDLEIISATITIRIWATVATAFEGKFDQASGRTVALGTVVQAEVGVAVDVGIKIAFFTINIHFAMTLDISFTLIEGSPTASIAGPSDPGLAAFVPPGGGSLKSSMFAATAFIEAPALRTVLAEAPIRLHFVLHPAVTYDAAGIGTAQAIATLLIESPGPNEPQQGPKPVTDFERLAKAIALWLLNDYGPDWARVKARLAGTKPDDFEAGLAATLGTLQFRVAGADLGDQRDETSAAIFPMFDALVLTPHDSGSPIQFGTKTLTGTGYSDSVARLFKQLNSLTASPPTPAVSARIAAGEAAPTGPSVAHMLFVNWFLALARQMAAVLLTGAAMPNASQLASIAGLVSRMALHGTRLPEPSAIQNADTLPDESAMRPLYALDGQQFAVGTGGAVQASLSLAAGGAGDPSIVFDDPTPAIAMARLPLNALPPVPDPGWTTEADGKPGLSVTAMPPVAPGPWRSALSARTQAVIPGIGQTPFFLMPLPQDAMAQLALGPRSGTVLVQPNDNAPMLPSVGGLLIPVSLRQVPVQNLPGPVSAPAAVTRFATDVFELVGTDDDTRALLERALDDPNLPIHAVVPLYSVSNGLTANPPAKSPEPAPPVLLFKTSLSTTTAPNPDQAPLMLMRLAATAVQPDEGPVSATVTNVRDFLRLVWECSVVHAGGFHLRHPDLPATLFQNGKGAAPFWFWLDLGDPTQQAPLHPSCNTIAIHDRGDQQSKSTLYLSLGDKQNNPVTVFHPTYPAGSVGVELVWTDPPIGPAASAGALAPYSAMSIAALYHMVELSLAGPASGSPVAFGTSPWSPALSPIEQDAPALPARNVSAANPPLRYRQVVPVWQHVSNSSSPYAAIGGSARLKFRISDVYGNVLPETLRGFAHDFPVVYNDPLVSPAAWPGCQVSYDLASGALTIKFEFSAANLPKLAPSAANTTQGGPASPQSIAKWITIVQQLAGPQLTASLTSTLFGDDWPAVGADADLLGQLQTIATRILSEIQSGSPQPLQQTIRVPIDAKQVASRQTDIFPLGVRLTLARGGVDPAVREALPTVASVTAELPPALRKVDQGSSLLAWVVPFEAMFKGFDGADGQVKLAQRPLSAETSPGGTPALWAVRLSGTAGIRFEPAQPQAVAQWTMPPFETKLLFGATAITVFDGLPLAPKQSMSSPAAVDVDALAAQFVGNVDRILAPDLAAGIARSNPAAYHRLMASKGAIAHALSLRLVPLLASGTAPGDLAKAQAQFEQAMLSQLSNAYAIAAVVQAKLSVSVAAGAEKDAILPPRFFGGLTTDTAAGTTLPYAVTAAKLALQSSGSFDAWLTFLVSVRKPETLSTVSLNPIWAISQIEHLFEPGEQRYGYLPSGWLKFLLASGNPALEVPLGPIEVPVPLRQYPASPRLDSQTALAKSVPSGTACATVEDIVARSLQWRYAATIAKEIEPQDDLWLSITFNQPLDWRPAPATGGEPLTPLAAALVRFHAGYDSLAPLLPLLSSGDAQASAVAEALVSLVEQVAMALGGGPAFLAAFAVPAVERRRWVLRYQNAPVRQTLTAYAEVMDDGSVLWPAISGKEPSGIITDPSQISNPPDRGVRWHQATYELGDKLVAPLEIVLDDLSLLQRQTAVASAHVVRNADLENVPVNPSLAYRTPDVSFPSVIAPYFDISGPLGPIDGSSQTLTAIISSILTPLAAASAAEGGERTIRIAASYRYPLVMPERGGPPLMAHSAAILNAGQILEETRVQGIATEFAANLGRWHQSVKLPAQGASLSLALSLFVKVGTQRIPLLKLQQVDVSVPASWWSDG